MDDVAISLRGVSKRYEVFGSRRARLAHALWPSYRSGMQEVWALRDVELDVRRGETVGVIGRNGGGKSTLVQIVTGVLSPTAGEVRVNGRVCALLELGSGFNPEYTGRDNVVLNGLLLGLPRAQILRRFGEIADFAEIGDAIDRPVKTYSSGMLVRLAFAVQVLTDPEILVIDEALSVGDFFFQQKCFERIRALRERGVTLVFVSHDMGTVRDLCARSVYLREGRIAFVGDSHDAVRRYLADRPAPAASFGLAAPSSERAGAGELQRLLREAAWTAPAGREGPGRLLAVALCDAQGDPASGFRIGEAMRVKVAYLPSEAVPTHVTAVIRNRYNQVVTSIGSSRLGLTPPDPEPAPRPRIFDLSLELRVEAGDYSVTVTLAHQVGANRGENLDASDLIGPVTVRWDYEKDVAPFLGMFGLPAKGAFRHAPELAEEEGP